MSKNMTRKDLAFGAAFALIATGFVGAPATATVDDSAVSLLPKVGSEYTGLLGQVFDLEMTNSAAASDGGGNIKFLVKDPDRELIYDTDGSAGSLEGLPELFLGITDADLEGDELVISGSGDPSTADATFRTQGTPFDSGDLITVAGDTVVTSESVSLVDGANNYVASSGTVTITFDSSGLPDIPDDGIESVTIESLDGELSDDATRIDADDLAELNGTHSDVTSFTQGGSGEIVIGSLSVTDAVGSTITDGTIRINLSDAAEDLLEGAKVVTGDVQSDGSESFTYEFGDTGKWADGTYVVNKFKATGLQTAASYNSDDEFVIDSGSDPNDASDLFLRLASLSTDAHSVEVTAWIDDINNDKIDPTELSSSTRTVNFVEFKDSGATLDFEQPSAGDDKLTATLSFGSNFNAESIEDSGNAPKVSFAIIDDAGEYYEATANSAVSTAGSFNVSEGTAMVFDDSDYPDVWSQSVDLAIDSGADIDGISYDNNLGAPQGYTFVTEVIYDGAAISAETFKSTEGEDVDIMFQPAPALGENVRKVSGALSGNVATYKVRSETTSALELNSTLWAYNKTLADNLDDSIYGKTSVAYGVEYVPSGTVVDVEVAEVGSSLDSDSVISVNGEELTSGDDPIEFTTTTNSAGVASISLANSEGVAGDSVTVKYSVDAEVKTTTLTWGDADDANIVFDVSNPVVSIEQEGSVSVDYFAYDEFGKGLSSPDYQVRVDDVVAVGDSSSDKEIVELSNGVGTLSFTDESESNGSYNVVGQLRAKGNDADYTNVTSKSETTAVNVVADASPAIVELDAVTDDASGSVDVERVPMTNLDARYDSNAALAAVPTFVTEEAYNVEGIVKNANGALLRGVEVTLSGADLGFNTGDMGDNRDQLYTTGSITVVTDANGKFAVEARSNIAGKHVVTATSGTGSDTTDDGEIDFEAAKATEGTNLDVSISPEQVTPQGTVKVTISLKDAFGNPVEVDGTDTISKFGKNQTPTIKVEYNGDGIAFGLGTGDATNEDGLATFDVLLGIDDVDPNSVVVEYNADGIDTTTSDNYVVQASQASYGSMTAWTVDQGDGTAKVYVKFPTIGEKVRIGHQTGGSGSYETIFVKTLDSETDSALTVNAEGSYIVRTIDLVDGTNRIRVTVGDSTEVQVRYNE